MPTEEVIDKVYLPYSRSEVAAHFLNAKHVDYFAASAKRYRAFKSRHSGELHGMGLTPDVKRGRQIEKDERFWTLTALKSIHDAGNWKETLARAFQEQRASADVSRLLGLIEDSGDLRLWFEVDMPSPESYRAALAAGMTRRHFIPYVLDASHGRTGLEGPTQVDALLADEKNGFAVLFEAKVLSDIACQVTFDVFRNQIARNIDVMLDRRQREGLPERDPEHTFFCLLTPRWFREKPESRLYGRILNEYRQNPDALRRDLPHRDEVDFAAVARRIGWLTFEDCNEIHPGSCPWLKAPA